MSLNTGNQQHADRSEINIAADFISMLGKRNVKSTCFVTGRAFEEEWNDLKPICDDPLVEIGGHTYNCFMPELWHRGWNKLIGSYNGPRWHQNWDIQKTKNIIKQKTGRSINAWRNHMYMHGPYTEELLIKNDIQICCDGVQKSSAGMDTHSTGLLNFPLNIIPDHEHLYHAERTPEWVRNWVKRYSWSDDYGSESYYFNDWLNIVIDGIKEREAKDLVSHMIIHPITIYLCGGLPALTKVADTIAQYSTIQVSELSERNTDSCNNSLGGLHEFATEQCLGDRNE
jgi:hypothetical protein